MGRSQEEVWPSTATPPLKMYRVNVTVITMGHDEAHALRLAAQELKEKPSEEWDATEITEVDSEPEPRHTVLITAADQVEAARQAESFGLGWSIIDQTPNGTVFLFQGHRHVLLAFLMNEDTWAMDAQEADKWIQENV